MVEGVQGQKDVCVPRSDCFPEGARGWDTGPLALHLEVGLGYGCQASLISQAAASEALHGVLIFFYVCVCRSGLTCHCFDLWAPDSRHIWFNYLHPPVDLEAQVCKAWPPYPSFMAACVCACACMCVCVYVCVCMRMHKQTNIWEREWVTKAEVCTFYLKCLIIIYYRLVKKNSIQFLTVLLQF